MTLSEVCDLIWADAFDDVGGFTDRHRYREAMYHIIILGEDPPKYDEKEDGTPTVTPSKSQLDDKIAQARAIRERAIQKKAQAGGVALPASE